MYKQIVSNTTHNTITEIPKDYKKPIGFHHDFGLLLNKEGIKKHTICFNGNYSNGYGYMEFPFTMGENPNDYVNTSFIPKSPLVESPSPTSESIIQGEFDLSIGNQWTWRDKTESLIPEFEDDNIFIWSMYFSNKKDVSDFKKKYEGSNPFYVNVELSPILRMDSCERVEYYCELNFKGYDKRDTMEEFYKKLSEPYKEVS